jgi:hypothetical protein
MRQRGRRPPLDFRAVAWDASGSHDYACPDRLRLGQSALRRRMSCQFSTVALAEWLEAYKTLHAAEITRDPELARWLEEEYTPLAGGWHY